MKKHFLLALLALFPLFALAGQVKFELTKAEALTTDEPVTFSELVKVTEDTQEGRSWYGWAGPSEFSYKAYKLVNGQFSEEATYSGNGSAYG